MTAKFTINGRTVEITEIDVQQFNLSTGTLYQAAVTLTVNGEIIDGLLFQDDVNEDYSRDEMFTLGNEFELSCRPLYRQLLTALGADEDPDADRIAEQLIALDGFDCLIDYINGQIKTQTAPGAAKTMTALELYEAAFDSACDDATDTVDYIVQYADGAFDLFITDA